MAESHSTPDGYVPQTAHSLREYLVGIDAVRGILGGNGKEWSVREVGDGNLNLVFIVMGPAGGIAVKQALPYVRLVGESWPLPLSRAHFEHLALVEQERLAGSLVPSVIHYDAGMALIVMELLQPHIIMRQGMIAATRYPGFSEAISTFLARTLFLTSDLALPAFRKKNLVAAFAGNSALCKITEDLIFTDPYREAELNRWTSPYLDGFARRWREDGELKIAVSRLKLKFLSSAEALLHGDLHTGSIMVTLDDTRVIDPEFAFMGPMGFDIGAVIANLLINYFSHDGHEERPGARDSYRDWVLTTLVDTWTRFRSKFLALWEDEAWGDAYPVSLFSDSTGREALADERHRYMNRLWTDSLGFAGAKMTRRILGLAHNIDLEWIKDSARRAQCEARALTLSREMMVSPHTFSSVDELCARARQMRLSSFNL